MRIVRVDGVPAGEDAVGAATAIKDASLDGGKRAGDIFKGFCAAMSIRRVNLLKGHHCWVLRAFAHRRACLSRLSPVSRVLRRPV